MRINTFGNGTVEQKLDELLSDVPYSTSVGRLINQYKEEFAEILKIPNMKIRRNLLAERVDAWMKKIDEREWSIDIKSYTKNHIKTFYRKKFHGWNK